MMIATVTTQTVPTSDKNPGQVRTKEEWWTRLGINFDPFSSIHGENLSQYIARNFSARSQPRVSQVILGQPFTFYIVGLLDAIHDLLDVTRSNHKIIRVRTNVFVVSSAFTFPEPHVLIVSCVCKSKSSNRIMCL